MFLTKLFESKGLKIKTPTFRFREGFASAVTDDKFYIFGGAFLNEDGKEVFLDDLHCFDFKTQKWKELFKSTRQSGGPAACINAAASVSNGRLYIMGGRNNPYQQGLRNGDVDSYFHALDLTIMKWSVINIIFNQIEFHHFFEFSDSFYLLGGYTNFDSDEMIRFPNKSSVERTVECKIPKNLKRFGYCLFEGKLYIFGGIEKKKISNEVYCYDFSKKKWEKMNNMSHPMTFNSALKVSNKNRIIYGHLSEGFYEQYEFDPMENQHYYLKKHTLSSPVVNFHAFNDGNIYLLTFKELSKKLKLIIDEKSFLGYKGIWEDDYNYSVSQKVSEKNDTLDIKESNETKQNNSPSNIFQLIEDITTEKPEIEIVQEKTSVIYKDKVYIIVETLSKMIVYDLKKNEWIDVVLDDSLFKGNSPKISSNACLIGDLLYIIGGENELLEIYILDFSSLKWGKSSKSISFKAPIYIFERESCFYVMDHFKMTRFEISKDEIFNETKECDLKNEEFSFCIYNDKLYTFGREGVDYVTYEYDFKSKSWARKCEIKETLSCHSAFTSGYDSIVHLLIDQKKMIRVYEYDVKNDKHIFIDQEPLQNFNMIFYDHFLYFFDLSKKSIPIKIRVVSKKYEIIKKIKETTSKEEIKWRDFVEDTIKLKNYKKSKAFGAGAFGKIWMALKKEKIVALKEISCDSPNQMNICISEAFNAMKLNHPRILKYNDVFSSLDEDEGIFKVYIEMELYPLGDLSKFIMTYEIDELLLSDFCYQILDGIEYIHSNGLIHRDLKPQNILVKLEDDSFYLTICDFGAAKNLESMNVGSFAGTETYVAPEMMKREEICTDRVDIFSFGAILYRFFTGKERRFYYDLLENESKVIQEIKNEIQALSLRNQELYLNVILSCLSQDPKQRPSATELKKLFSKEIKLESSNLKLQEIIEAKKSVERPLFEEKKDSDTSDNEK